MIHHAHCSARSLARLLGLATGMGLAVLGAHSIALADAPARQLPRG
jgi:hypothetical protein